MKNFLKFIGKEIGRATIWFLTWVILYVILYIVNNTWLVKYAQQ